MPRAHSESISKTRLFALAKAWEWNALTAALAGRPELLSCRAPKGETLLHLSCGVDLAKRGNRSSASIRTAEVLLDAGLDVNAAAFTEGGWKATPLWYAIGRGKNLPLARYLLERGSTAEYCLWAAAYNDSAAAVRLLCDSGASIDPPGGETPLLFAVKWSRFAAAKALLECGADPNYRDTKGKAALDYMLKKRSDEKYVRLFLKHGAAATGKRHS